MNLKRRHEPRSDTCHHARVRHVTADGGEKVLQEMFEFWDLINTQDIEIVENVQQGTAAPA